MGVARGRGPSERAWPLYAALAASLLLLAASVYAQVKRPFRNGSVWSVSYIRMKPGMETAYLNYIATDWKRNQEA